MLKEAVHDKGFGRHAGIVLPHGVRFVASHVVLAPGSMISPRHGPTKEGEGCGFANSVLEYAVANDGDTESVPPQAKAVLVVDKIHEEISPR